MRGPQAKRGKEKQAAGGRRQGAHNFVKVGLAQQLVEGALVFRRLKGAGAAQVGEDVVEVAPVAVDEEAAIVLVLVKGRAALDARALYAVCWRILRALRGQRRRPARHTSSRG